MTTTVHCGTAAETRALGEALGALAEPGDVIVLTGPLGAGKTVLTQGIGAGLGVGEPVTSPTFVIARVHESGRIPLVHVDAYRLGGSVELDDLDLDAEVAGSVTVVEWGAGIAERLSDSHLDIALDRGGDDEHRTITLVGHGASWPGRLARLGALI